MSADPVSIRIGNAQSFPLSIRVDSASCMTIRYGRESHTVTSYDEAWQRIGAVIMHALATDGHLPEDFLTEGSN